MGGPRAKRVSPVPPFLRAIGLCGRFGALPARRGHRGAPGAFLPSVSCRRAPGPVLALREGLSVKEVSAAAASSVFAFASQPRAGRWAAPAGGPRWARGGEACGGGRSCFGGAVASLESGKLCAGKCVGAEGSPGRLAKPPGSGGACGNGCFGSSSAGLGGDGGVGLAPSALFG